MLRASAGVVLMLAVLLGFGWTKHTAIHPGCNGWQHSGHGHCLVVRG